MLLVLMHSCENLMHYILTTIFESINIIRYKNRGSLKVGGGREGGREGERREGRGRGGRERERREGRGKGGRERGEREGGREGEKREGGRGEGGEGEKRERRSYQHQEKQDLELVGADCLGGEQGTVRSQALFSLSVAGDETFQSGTTVAELLTDDLAFREEGGEVG